MEYLREEYSPIYGGQKSDSAPKLPYVYFFQIDGATELTTLSDTEDGISLAFQIEVYTDKGMNEARKIANSIRTYMIQNSFKCRTFIPDQSSLNVSRFLTRFRRLDV